MKWILSPKYSAIEFSNMIKLEFENYTSKLSQHFLFIFCKSWCGNHLFPKKIGRWHNISWLERFCTLCGSSDIHVGDVFHCISSCCYFKNEIKQYVSSFYWTNFKKFKQPVPSKK